MSGARKTDGTGRSELRDTLEGTEHGKRRKSGTYNAGVKDLASAYVLCPRLVECGGLSNYERDKVCGITRGLEAGL